MLSFCGYSYIKISLDIQMNDFLYFISIISSVCIYIFKCTYVYAYIFWPSKSNPNSATNCIYTLFKSVLYVV